MSAPRSLQPPSRHNERLVALIITAAILFCPPLLLVVDRLPSVTGVWLVIWLFGAWALVIGLTAWLMEGRQPPAPSPEPEARAAADQATSSHHA